MITWCEDCDHPIKEREPYRWLCRKHPTPDKKGYVVRDVWAGEPYQRCYRINTDGNCKDFEPKRSLTNEAK